MARAAQGMILSNGSARKEEIVFCWVVQDDQTVDACIRNGVYVVYGFKKKVDVKKLKRRGEVCRRMLTRCESDVVDLVY